VKYLPIAVKIKGRRVIVVGGGKIALRKVLNFLDAGARVHVIAPALHPEMRGLYTEGKITWDEKLFSEDDIKGAALVVSATDKKVVNEKVSRAARKKDIAVNVVDQPGISDFISPAIIRHARAIIAVYTDGKDPALSRDIKDYLKEMWDDFLLFRDRP
jgi:siroheme synthase-like protein